MKVKDSLQIRFLLIKTLPVAVAGAVVVVANEWAPPLVTLAALILFTAISLQEIRGVANDVSEHKRLAAQIATLSRWNSTVLQAASDGIQILDEHGKVVEVNDSFCRMLGYSRGELLSRNVAEWDVGHTPERLAERLRRSIQEPLVFETVHHRKDGTQYPAEISGCGIEIDGTWYIYNSVRDITERKRAQQIDLARLRLLECAESQTLDELLEKTVDEAEELSGSSIGFYHFVDDDQLSLTLENWSKRTKAEFCKAEAKWLHYPIADAGVWADCVRERRPVVHNDYATVLNRKGMPEGHAEVVREFVVPVIRGEKFKAILGVGNKSEDYTEDDVRAVSILADLAWDITERKLAQEAVRKAAAYGRSLLEASLDPLVTIGPDGRVTDVNHATEEATGLVRAELVGSDFADYFSDPEAARAGYERVFQDGLVTDYPLELRHRDGGTRSVLYNASVYRDEEGRVVGVFAAARDVTERKQAEEAVRNAAAYTRSLIEASLDPLVTIGPEGRITDVNHASELATGRGRADLIGSDFADYFTDPDAARAGYRRVFQDGQVQDYPLELRHVDGGSRSFLCNASLYRDQAGNVVGVFAAARDVTERKLAEAALQRANHLLDDTQAITRFGGWDYDAATKRITWTDEVYRIYGVGSDYDPSDVARDIGHYAPGHAPIIEEAFRRAVESGEPYDLELEFIRADGEHIWVRTSGRPVVERGHVVRVTGNIGDITERKLAELAKEQYFQFFKLSADAMCIADPFGCFREVNPAFSQMTGYTAEELVAKPFLDFVVQEDRQRTSEEMALQVSQRPSLAFENHYVRKDGRVILLSWTAYFDMTDGVTYARARDITDQRRAEQELNESRARLQALMDGTTDAIFVKDLHGRYLMANRAVSVAVGRPVEGILGKDDLALFPEVEARAVMERDRETMALGSTRTYEEGLIVANGESRTFLATKGPLFDEAGKVVGLFGVSRDITERKHMEAALLQSAKLESLGDLAGGLAHDFNNILTVILGNSALAVRGIPKGSSALEAVEEIEKAAKRGAELARFLLDAAGGEAFVVRPVDLGALGREIASLLTPSFAPRVAITCRLEPDLPPVGADEASIGRLLATLVVNGAEAIGTQNGTVVLTTGVIDLGEADVDNQFPAQGLRAGKYVYLKVTDDGPGMSPEVAAKVFDPFFTTKFAGRGLGLAAAQGIARAHRGTIDLTTTPGEGATFRLLLPVGQQSEHDATTSQVS